MMKSNHCRNTTDDGMAYQKKKSPFRPCLICDIVLASYNCKFVTDNICMDIHDSKIYNIYQITITQHELFSFISHVK